MRFMRNAHDTQPTTHSLSVYSIESGEPA
jgi:hypothetical protein